MCAVIYLTDYSLNHTRLGQTGSTYTVTYVKIILGQLKENLLNAVMHVVQLSNQFCFSVSQIVQTDFLVHTRETYLFPSYQE